MKDIDFSRNVKGALGKFYLVLVLCMIIIPSIVCRGNGWGSDSSAIRIGEPIPQMTFEKVFNSQFNMFSTNDLKGKPTVIYFFSSVCRSSFLQLTKINRIHTLHENDFNLIMVGIDLNDDIQNIYRKYSERYSLDLPVAFDRTIYKQYGIKSVPLVIWINKAGVVQAITNVLDFGYLDQFIRGEGFDFISYASEGKALLRNFNPDEPFLIDGNGGTRNDFIQRSILAEWRIGMPNSMPYAPPNRSPLEGLKHLQAIGRGLNDLYRIAYFGKTYAWTSKDSAYGVFHYSPILEIEDDSKFKADHKLGKNLFCYSQTLPPNKRNPAQMMKIMQSDLRNFFGYDVTIETRQMPYLKLVATDVARSRLKTRGAAIMSRHSLVQIDFVNKPVSSLISILSGYLNLTSNDLPLIDKTGIQGNIDISIDAIMTDIEDVNLALRKWGLSMCHDEKPMKVIVIRESKLQ